MPRKQVTRLRKLCGQLAGHSWQHAERVTDAAIELARPWLPEGQETLNQLDFLLCVAEKLEAQRDHLTAIDNRHAHELQVDRDLREQRDAIAFRLRLKLQHLRDSLDGLFGRGGATKIFQEAPAIPVDPVALHQLTGHVRSNLDNETFSLPETRQEGFLLDRQGAIRDFDELFQQLGEVLRQLELADSASKHTQSLKDQAVEESRIFSGKVGRYLEALFDLVGFDRLAGRLRRSTHRSSNEPEPEVDGEVAEAQFAGSLSGPPVGAITDLSAVGATAGASVSS